MISSKARMHRVLMHQPGDKYIQFNFSNHQVTYTTQSHITSRSYHTLLMEQQRAMLAK